MLVLGRGGKNGVSAVAKGGLGFSAIMFLYHVVGTYAICIAIVGNFCIIVFGGQGGFIACFTIVGEQVVWGRRGKGPYFFDFARQLFRPTSLAYGGLFVYLIIVGPATYTHGNVVFNGGYVIGGCLGTICFIFLWGFV